MTHFIRFLPGIGHQVLKRGHTGHHDVLGTYDDKDEADTRLEEERTSSTKEHEQRHWSKK